MNINPVIQEEETGCGIAAVANILGKSYKETKKLANSMGIYASDKSLWSDTNYVRQILTSQNIKTSDEETPFSSWESLPDKALLAIKYHKVDGKNFWHWVVFMRLANKPIVLDSAAYLPSNLREDFEQMQPKWFIEVIE